MNRRVLVRAVLGMGPLQLVCLFAQGQSKGKGKGKGQKTEVNEGQQPERHYFRPQDYGVVQRYYDGPRDLPPGLRKKYYRTGSLPPGWQKKIRQFPPELVRALPPLPPQYDRGYIDGVAIVYDRKTRIILDSIDLIGAIAGH